MVREVNPESEQDVQLGFDDFEMTLGDVMRGERATLGKSLEDVEFDLKIKKVYIEAIENSDAEAFASPGFISGYVRSYASYLNMDSDAAFEKFCDESGYDGLRTSLEISPNRQRTKKPLVGGIPATTSSDPFINPRVPNRPQASGILSGFSASGVASVVVLAGLIGGLGFGGWSILQEIQRVEFAPVESTPGVTTTVTVLGGGTNLETGVGLSAAGLGKTDQKKLEDIYRPEELDIPQLVARDGPISAINPDTFGNFISVAAIEEPPVIPEQPVVTVSGPPPVDIVAVNPAWIRVSQKSGGVLFEKILDAGERYRVPEDVPDAILRAGNSGSVYVMIGEDTYGPVGVKTGVARKVELAPELVTEKYAAVEGLFETPLADPVNAPVTAEVVQE